MSVALMSERELSQLADFIVEKCDVEPGPGEASLNDVKRRVYEQLCMMNTAAYSERYFGKAVEIAQAYGEYEPPIETVRSKHAREIAKCFMQQCQGARGWRESFSAGYCIQVLEYRERP